MSTGQTPSYHTSEDEQILHKLGYAQELFRAMGGFQNFAISFTIISILAGCLTSFSVGFEHGGPSSIIWGWLLVGLMATIISLSMAEIASAYPTAGGLYYWASKLGSPGWGWTTGWFNLIGQVAVTAAIGYGLATFGAVLLDFWFDYYAHMDDWFGATANASIYILYATFMVAACVINLFNIRITAGLNTFSAYWHMVGVAFIVGVLIIVPDRHQSLSYVFTETVNNSGFGDGTTSWSNPVFWFVWGLGLLLAQYTITGFDASAHTAEETGNASRMAATGMWTSVVASVFFGWILLLAVTFAIPSTEGALENIGTVVPWIWAESMSQKWAECLLFICVVAQFFCLTASVTSASRMMFAFSRDGAVPGHQLWRRVARNRVPRWSVLGIGFFSAVLMIPAIWNYLVGYFVGTAIAVIGLYIAFVIPVFLRLRKGDAWDEPRAWSLGRHYKWIDTVSLIWVAFITILFVFPLYKAGLPWEDDFTWELTNYTVLWFAGIGIIFGGWWFLSAKKWFKGPVRMGTAEELEQLEERQLSEFDLPTESA
ncbi:MAG TPA: amino acid permease [Gaiellaceae bacterium]|jgi:amino acid transporter|nr:amino acid permease [Gaiellaceae bacterium]